MAVDEHSCGWLDSQQSTLDTVEFDRTFDFWDTMDSINNSSLGLLWPQSELVTQGSGEQHMYTLYTLYIL